MSYLGKTPSQATRSRFYYTATGGETSLSGADDNSNTLVFSDGNFVDVMLNGVTLVAGTDYNTTTANTIGGLTALVASDVVEIIVYDTFSVFGGDVKGDFTIQNGTLTAGAVTSTGIDVTGTVTADGLTVDGGNTIRLNAASSDDFLTITQGTSDANISAQSAAGNANLVFSTTTVGTTRQRMDIATNGDISFYESTGTTPKLFWDASAESLGIGTTSPDSKLTVANVNSWHDGVQIRRDTPGDQYLALGYDIGVAYIAAVDESPASAGDGQTISFGRSSDGSTFTEAMRIDSSGNLLVGKTSASGSTTGCELRPDGIGVITNDGSNSLQLRRLTSDGTILEFRKDTSIVGSIGTFSGDMYVGTGGTTLRFHDGDSRIRPANSTGGDRDNAIDIGTPSARFDDIYATNGTIQTSDRNEKQDIEELSEAEQRVAVATKALMRKFRWKDKVAEKGDDARIHFGIIAQDLQEAFEAEGLDAGRYAMFISSTWWESEETYTDDDGVEQTRTDTYDTANEAPEGATERTRLGVRYPELLAFIIAAI